MMSVYTSLKTIYDNTNVYVSKLHGTVPECTH